MFSSKFRYLFIIVLAVYSYFNTLFSKVYQYYNIAAASWLIIGVFFFITLLVWESNRLLQRLLHKLLPDKNLLQFLLLFFITGMVVSSLISYGIIYLVDILTVHLSNATYNIVQRLGFTYATRINLFMHVINAVILFIQQFKSKAIEAEELKRINTQAQLQSIKNQINPHFLFNNLNILSSLVLLENPDANKFIEEFSLVYRHILSSQKEELVQLSHELDFLGHYNYLLAKRFPQSIHISVDIADKYLEYYVLPVALQMLIENAIKHNSASQSKALYVKIFNEEDYLIVQNNLQLKTPEEESTQVGLKNIAQRYRIIAEKEIKVHKTEDSFSVMIPLIAYTYENNNYRR